MERKIRVLSESTINQIAAGEVIENPASVVKELVENAIDASASQIEVVISRGGFALIQIVDDGEGMSHDDALLALERHATSKIQSSEDLLHLSTMGFRGEALASISAVSKLTLTTSPNAELATQIFVSGGQITHVKPASRKRGTTLEVKSLFFNVPARMKFQKSPASTQTEIVKVMTQLALTHPEIAFSLTCDGKNYLRVQKGSLEERIQAVLGSSFQKDIHKISEKSDLFSLEGIIGAPYNHRLNRSGQFLLVNGRVVVCPEINFAIYDGYGTRLQPRTHPIYVLHFQLPPDQIDVNVHPQKREIRLRNKDSLKAFIKQAVSSAFNKRLEVKKISQPLHFEAHEPLNLDFNLYEKAEETPLIQEIEIIGMYDNILMIEKSHFLYPLDFEDKEGMILIHLQAASERIAYEQIMQSAREENAPQDGLLFPVTLEFSASEASLINRYLSDIARLGIHLRPFGAATYVVDALASSLKASTLQQLVLELIDSLDAGKTLEDLCIVASRYSHGNKQGYTLREAREIVKQLMKTEGFMLSPRGQKTIDFITKSEMYGRFSKPAHRALSTGSSKP